VKRQQLILTGAGIVLMASLFFFGKTVAKKEDVGVPGQAATSIPLFNWNSYLQAARQKLPVYQQNYLNNLENSVKRGDVKEQQIKLYNQLASFWKDSVHQTDFYIFYTAEAAKLVNSEKNLTFAARLTLKDLRNEEDNAKRGWKAEQAISLFEKAIELNPNNDSLQVELGSCYVFGKGMAGDAQSTMKGIQQLLKVAKKDSANMEAQLVLGIGGVISSQYDKAVDRLLNVVKTEPGNIEAISWLADAYAGKGDKTNALKWYEVSKRMINDPAYTKAVDERIKMLK
jgi:tetratricopeptide (TPR) repeat protein